MPKSSKYLPRFHDPAILHEFNEHRLRDLLLPHADFLASHGAALAETTTALDVQAIAKVILQPHDDTPYELVDALTHIHEMATPEGMERLQNAAQLTGIVLDPTIERTPADLALELWLDAPELLRRQHAEHIVLKRRALYSYFPRPDVARVRPGDLDGALARFETAVRKWYREQGRGDGASVIVFDDQQETRLVIRYGGPYQRRGCLQDDQPGTVQFRPMEFAYVVVKWQSLELAMNCRLKGERELFRRAIGEAIFGQSGFFSIDTKYSLEPLRLGRPSLRRADVPGIRNVRLVSLTVDKDGPHHRVDTICADDVFRAIDDDGDLIPRTADLISAKLLFEFTDSKKERAVTIRAGNRATYTRDDTELVERFLVARGFMKGHADGAALATA